MNLCVNNNNNHNNNNNNNNGSYARKSDIIMFPGKAITVSVI